MGDGKGRIAPCTSGGDSEPPKAGSARGAEAPIERRLSVSPDGASEGADESPVPAEPALWVRSSSHVARRGFWFV